jgi:Na+/H+-translocating membrane pyrophosphatase
MDLNGEKTKDHVVYRILNFYNKFNEGEIKNLKYAMIFIPILLVIILNLVIQTRTILIICSVNIFSLVAIFYAILILIDILSKETGNDKMREIADAIREGSEGFFLTQYTTIFQLSIVFGIAIFLFYFGREVTPDEVLKNILGNTVISIIIVFSFFIGALCSAFSGYTGMWVSVRTNIRLIFVLIL